MRIVTEIPHPECKITIFSWNNRYLIKFETGFLEQTYKINQYDVTSESDLQKIVTSTLLPMVLVLFNEMDKNLQNTLIEL